MDIILTIPEEQLLFYTKHINDRYLKEKAREKGFKELYELLDDQNLNPPKNEIIEPAGKMTYSM